MERIDEVKRLLRNAQGSERHAKLPDQIAAELKRQLIGLKRDLVAKSKVVTIEGDNTRSLQDWCDQIEDRLDMTLWSVMISIAASDGPINADEARLMNAVFDRSIDVAGYANTMLPTVREMDLEQTFGFCVNLGMQLALQECGDITVYDPQSDPLLQTIELLGQAIMNADEYVSVKEATEFARFTSIAHEKAAELRRRIDGLVAQAELEADGGASPKPMVAPKSDDPVHDCLAELHSLVGLDGVKREVETLVNLAKVFALRRAKGIPVPPFSFHLVFSGNPGTGKTTVARIIARIYGALGLLEPGGFLEVDRSGLVGNYIGQTANKTKKVVDAAIGGVLFIDEAYALSRGSENDYGAEAIEVILKAMEDHRSSLIVIAAGYTDRMSAFLSSNPGLKSRFPRTLEFPDYSPDEMSEIFERLIEQNGYRLDSDAKSAVDQRMQTLWQDRTAEFANARDVRNLFESAITAQANRIAEMSDIDDLALCLMTDADVRFSAGAK